MPSPRMIRSNQGFSLMELMVTVVIAGLLTVIAVPAYTSYTLRANRSVAKAALVDIAAREETYFVDRKGYTQTFSDLNLPGTTASYLSRDGSFASTQVSTAIYQLSVAALTTATCPATGTPSIGGYTLIATPVGSQLSRDTTCGSICLTSSGIRLASAGTADSCWSR